MNKFFRNLLRPIGFTKYKDRIVFAVWNPLHIFKTERDSIIGGYFLIKWHGWF